MGTESTWVSGTVLFKERYTDPRGRLEWSPGLYQRAEEKGQQSGGKGRATGAGRDGRWCLTATQNMPVPLWEHSPLVLWKKLLSFCRQRIFAWVGTGWVVGVLCGCRFMLGFS